LTCELQGTARNKRYIILQYITLLVKKTEAVWCHTFSCLRPDKEIRKT